jgi:uncharacterized membrane protein (DUF485 family)
MITIVYIILALLFVFSIAFRTRIASLLRGAGLYVAGTWNMVWPVIEGTVITASIVGGISWLLFVVLMVAIGAYANAFLSGLIISLLFPVWFMAFMMPSALNKTWIIGPMVRMVRFVFSPVLVVAAFFLVVGIWSPAVKGSWDRRVENVKQEVANWFDKRSLKSEPEKGTFAKVTEDSHIYNDKRQSVAFVKKDTVVMIVKGLVGNKADENSEGHKRIMLPNCYGDFQLGKEGWIPIRKLGWDWEEEKPKLASSASDQAALPQPAKETSKVFKFNNEDSWLVKYYPGQNPGWIGPKLPQGKYEVSMRGDGGDIKARTGGGQEFQVYDKKVIDISENSSLEFYSSRGEEVKITVRRIV